MIEALCVIEVLVDWLQIWSRRENTSVLLMSTEVSDDVALLGVECRAISSYNTLAIRRFSACQTIPSGYRFDWMMSSK